MEVDGHGPNVPNGSAKTEGIKQYYVGKIEALQVSTKT